MVITLPDADPSRQRAIRALRCAPFCLPLFQAMAVGGVPLLQIAGRAGLDQGYTQKSLSAWGAEQDLIWLIQVGLLRREVDGQGITDSFRLTPLGRELLEWWQAAPGGRLPPPTWAERGLNFARRWGRWPV